jgi:hypothetical protein
LWVLKPVPHRALYVLVSSLALFLLSTYETFFFLVQKAAKQLKDPTMAGAIEI